MAIRDFLFINVPTTRLSNKRQETVEGDAILSLRLLRGRGQIQETLRAMKAIVAVSNYLILFKLSF